MNAMSEYYTQKQKGKCNFYLATFSLFFFTVIVTTAYADGNDTDTVGSPSMIQRVIQRFIHMPKPRETEEKLRKERELEQRRIEERAKRAEYAARVGRESVYDAVISVLTDGAYSSYPSAIPAMTRGMISSHLMVYEHWIACFVEEDARYRRIIDELIRLKSLDERGEIMKTKSALHDIARLWIQINQGVSVESIMDASSSMYEELNYKYLFLLPILVFHFFEPEEGLPLLLELRNSIVYATNVETNWRHANPDVEELEHIADSDLPENIKEILLKGYPFVPDVYDTSRARVYDARIGILVYVLNAYIEQVIIKYKDGLDDNLTPYIRQFQNLHSVLINYCECTNIYVEYINDSFVLKIIHRYESFMPDAIDMPEYITNFVYYYALSDNGPMEESDITSDK